MDEFERIARLLAPLAGGFPGALGLTDDAALIAPKPGEELVVTVDAMVEGVHFLPDDPPDLVARKLLRVNLSDLAAMGAVPLAYVMTTALPARCGDDWLARFCAGLATDQAAFAVSLAGGDSVSTPGPVTLSLTALGTLPAGTAVRRDGARAGDAVYVTGTVGDGALGLLAIRGALGALSAGHRDALAGRYRLPEPRVAMGPALRGTAHAMIDVSDGLVADLAHVAETSGVAAIVEQDRVPLSPAARAAVDRDPGLWTTVLTGGDDYELLFTGPPGLETECWPVPLQRIGRIEAGAGVRVVSGDGRVLEIARSGFRHF